MAKAKFQYDENGTTFFVILSFLALILLPSTYYLWPLRQSSNQSSTTNKSGIESCNCNGCNAKRQLTDKQSSKKKSRRLIVRAFILFGWIVFFAIIYRVKSIENEYINWDPYEILGIKELASVEAIKKAYRKLSLIYHPDKYSGNSDTFVQITKAYATLTDEESRKNWEEYGHPEGPRAATFGIALPSWIVEKENSFIVLGIYALVFMVALPISVGLWWYKSVKFGCDKVLLSTSDLFYFYIHKTPHMALKRVIMIVSAAFEFSKMHNNEIVERPSDNVEVPRLMRELNNLNEKNKERPLCYSYSIKTRAIIYAHLSRLKLPQNTLELDRVYIVQKCPLLIQEYVSCVSQLITLALAGRVQNKPALVTLENAMKLSPLIIQALWEYQSPLLQLPHFSEDTIKHLSKKHIKNFDQLIRLDNKQRRDLLHHFNTAQIEDIENVLFNLPSVKIESKVEVLDDEDPEVITSGSIVTATLKLKRVRLIDTCKHSQLTPTDAGQSAQNFEGSNESNKDDNDNEKENSKPEKAVNNIRRVSHSPSSSSVKETEGKEKKKKEADTKDDDFESDGFGVFDKKFQRPKNFEPKPKHSHPVHCPHFSDDKHEFWWVYLVDRKRLSLVTAPLLVTNLIETEEVELKFTAPPKPNTYSYTIVVRSDSYLDCNVQKTITFDVKAAKQIDPGQMWDISDDEPEDGDCEDSAVEDSDLVTDSE